ncbi:MAG: NAD-dependent epimerase/dehydratase family protein [Balneola sp.]|nr:MAG: NAD-dependent epimerase/dehydratase family protein [Balneola sp.]
MKQNKPKVLVTGGEGFVGSYLVPKLRTKNFEVIITSKLSGNKQNQIYQIDIRNLEEVSKLFKEQRPDYVFHLAAISSPVEKNISTIYDVNLQGSLNILESAQEYVPESTILMVSSGYVYGNYKDPIAESFPTNPINHYGISKLAMEKLVLAYKEKIKKIVLARPFNHTGQGQSENFVIAKVINTLNRQRANYDKLVLELGNIDAVRDFTDVNDIVEAYIDLIDKGKNLETYNISSNIGYSIRDTIRILEKILDTDIDVRKNEKFMRPSDMPILIGDNGKIIKEIGWKPKIRFPQLLEKMLKY